MKRDLAKTREMKALTDQLVLDELSRRKSLLPYAEADLEVMSEMELSFAMWLDANSNIEEALLNDTQEMPAVFEAS